MFNAVKKDLLTGERADRPGTLTFLVNKTKNRSDAPVQTSSMAEKPNEDLKGSGGRPVGSCSTTPTDPASLIPALENAVTVPGTENGNHGAPNLVALDSMDVDNEVSADGF